MVKSERERKEAKGLEAAACLPRLTDATGSLGFRRGNVNRPTKSSGLKDQKKPEGLAHHLIST